MLQQQDLVLASLVVKEPLAMKVLKFVQDVLLAKHQKLLKVAKLPVNHAQLDLILQVDLSVSHAVKAHMEL